MHVSSARRSFPAVPRRRAPVWSRLPALLAVGLLVGSLAAGCTDEKESAPRPAPTPLARLNTAAMDVPRIDFCPLVPRSAVSRALGGKADDDSSYGNGDEVSLPGVGDEVLHELGCSWSRDDGTTARAWLFARPVDAAFARTVIASSKQKKGCRTVPVPAYGEPSTGQVCRLSDGVTRVRHSGLFGETWLSCELSAAPSSTGTEPAPAELRRRAEQWCVEVVNAVNTAS